MHQTPWALGKRSNPTACRWTHLVSEGLPLGPAQRAVPAPQSPQGVVWEGAGAPEVTGGPESQQQADPGVPGIPHLLHKRGGSGLCPIPAQRELGERAGRREAGWPTVEPAPTWSRPQGTVPPP